MAVNAEFLAQQLQGLHIGISIVLRDGRWQISDQESAMLAEAMAHCCQAFDVSVDPRALALSELLGVAMMIYVPRYMMGRVQSSEDGQLDLPFTSQVETVQ